MQLSTKFTRKFGNATTTIWESLYFVKFLWFQFFKLTINWFSFFFLRWAKTKHRTQFSVRRKQREQKLWINKNKNINHKFYFIYFIENTKLSFGISFFVCEVIWCKISKLISFVSNFCVLVIKSFFYKQ